MFDWINITAVPIIGAVISAYLQQRTKLEIQYLRSSIDEIKGNHTKRLEAQEQSIEDLTLRVEALEIRQ